MEILAFRHPLAGLQIVKGTIEVSETPEAAALRELREEAGLTGPFTTQWLGTQIVGADSWHFIRVEAGLLPEGWSHFCEDDGGHKFQFFWHPLATELDERWHASFHSAVEFIRAVAS